MNEPSIESLAVHAEFLRAFARALLGADDRVDDVVQETFAVALAREPRDPAARRSWLAGILRNLVRRVRRREALEIRHEKRAARRPPEADPDGILLREEVRRSVLAALLALEPTYRRPLLLRYYEGLSPPEVAERLGVPLETARTRLKRGLAKLRARLDRDHGGDRRAWTLALLPLAGLRSDLATAATGALAMTTTGKLVLGLLLVLAVAGAGLALLAEPEPAPAAAPDPAEPPAMASDADPVPAAPAPAPEDAPAGLLVRVTDPAGRPAPGTALVVPGRRGSTVTGEDGTARLDLEGGAAVRLSVRAPGRRRARHEVPAGARETRIVVPVLRAVTGRVVDETGGPVVAATVLALEEIDANVRELWASAWPVELARYGRRAAVAAAESDAEGRFALDVEAGASFVLLAVRTDRRPEAFALAPDTEDAELRTRPGAVLTVGLRGPDGPLARGGVGLERLDVDPAECPPPLDPVDSLGTTADLPISFGPLVPGRWRVYGRATIDGAILASPEPAVVEIGAGERAEIEVEVRPPAPRRDDSVERVVFFTDEDGVRLDPVEIRGWWSAQAVLDAIVEWEGRAAHYERLRDDGTVRFRAPAGVSVRFTPKRDPGEASVTRVLPPGGGEVAFALPWRRAEAVHRISGRVVDERGDPVGGVQVTARDRARRRQGTKTGADGRFEFEGLLPGPWHVGAYLNPLRHVGVERSGAPPRDLVLTLPDVPAGRVDVQVFLPRGDFPRARVELAPLSPADGRTRPVRIHLAGAGTGSSPDLPPGRYRLGAAVPFPGGGVLDGADVTVEPGATTQVDLGRGLRRFELVPGAGDQPETILVMARAADGRELGPLELAGDGPFAVEYPAWADSLVLRAKSEPAKEPVRLARPEGRVVVTFEPAAAGDGSGR